MQQGKRFTYKITGDVNDELGAHVANFDNDCEVTSVVDARSINARVSGKAFVVQCRQAFTSRRKGDAEPSYRSETTSVRRSFEEVGCWLPIPSADSEITMELQREETNTSGR